MHSVAVVPKGRILLADDEESIRGAFTRLLRAHGYEVSHASSGEEALELLGRDAFDVVVTDVYMGGMTGVDLLRTVRERDMDVPVLLMTGDPHLETAVAAIELGAHRYVSKPIRAAALIASIETAQIQHEKEKLKRRGMKLVETAAREEAVRATCSASFDRALEGMWMAFQPIVRWSDRSGYAHEALLRSTEPSLPHPMAILDAAERLDRISDVGRRVRSRVAEAMEAEPHRTVFVNLHARDLMDDELYDPSSPLSCVAERVVLEVTERASLASMADVRRRTETLRALGYRIALDDYGAGYAGLTTFAELEPHIVKLDMSIVRDVHRSPTKRALIQSVLDFCRGRDTAVVAEGIETQAERDVLVECGCDLFQGYLFAKPGPGFVVPAF